MQSLKIHIPLFRFLGMLQEASFGNTGPVIAMHASMRFWRSARLPATRLFSFPWMIFLLCSLQKTKRL